MTEHQVFVFHANMSKTGKYLEIHLDLAAVEGLDELQVTMVYRLKSVWF